MSNRKAKEEVVKQFKVNGRGMNERSICFYKKECKCCAIYLIKRVLHYKGGIV